MRKLALIAAAAVWWAGLADPSIARESDAMVVSVTVLASCILDADLNGEAPAPRLSCNGVNAPAPQAEEPAEAVDRAGDGFAPVLETLESETGAVVRVTY